MVVGGGISATGGCILTVIETLQYPPVSKYPDMGFGHRQ